jgi:predicted acyltransferase
LNQAPDLVNTTSARYLSLDVLRGVTIAFMIIVNAPGNAIASYSQLKHAAWHGFTLTDLVFPTFLFVVGNAMAFTMQKYRREDQKHFLAKVFKRTVIIYIIGIFLNAYPFFIFDGSNYVLIDFTTIRLVGVLGRIAICYCVVSLIIYYAGPATAYIVSGIALMAYWWILYQFGDQPDPYSLTGNAVSKLDLLVLGRDHIWNGEGVPFDPEGLLSTVPAIVNVTAGFFSGQLIQKSRALKLTVVKLAVAGALLVSLAVIWNNAFPINKKLWTSSYVLITIGLDLVLLSILVFIIDIARMKRGTAFFEVFGRNPLTLYVLSYMITKLLYYIHTGRGNAKDWLYANIFSPFFDPAIASLLFSISIMMIVWIVGYFMNKRKLFIKV